MEEYLSLRVKGQEQAVREISETIRAARVGLKNPQRPSGVFFLAGPTGTGKTELARALAAFLFHDEKRLLRFDMSEYQEKHNVSRLIGAPPGYAGYYEEGQLTGAVRINPYSVILFDEIEKAHPDVFDIFLQILDAGRLTDGRGRIVNFSESIVIFTSNLGTSSFSMEQSQKKKIGFLQSDEDTKIDQYSLADSSETVLTDYKSKIIQSILAQFKPEFVNRLGRVVAFSPLNQEAIGQILDKIISETNQHLAEKEIRLVLDESACQFLVKKGYSKKFGARELERKFTHYVNEPLARMILNRDIQPPQVVKLGSDGESIILIPSYSLIF
jgi:ATP-dependent Clp protease ATP-binding subunit ClpC